MQITLRLLPLTIAVIFVTVVECEFKIDESILFELGKSCNSKDIRYDPKQLELLKNCRMIYGNLRISDMPEATTEQFKEFSYPNLTLITGYLVINNVNGLKTLSKLFPNLTAINGDETFREYSLLISKNLELKEIALPSLTQIGSGIIKVEGNPKLCFNFTGDYSKLTKNSPELLISSTKDDCDCHQNTSSCWIAPPAQHTCNCTLCAVQGDENECCLVYCRSDSQVYFSQNQTLLFDLDHYRIGEETCKSLGRTTINLKCIEKEECHQLYQHVYNESKEICHFCDEDCLKKDCDVVVISNNQEIIKAETCKSIKRLEIHNITIEHGVHEKLKKALSYLYDIKTCAIIKNSPGLNNLNFLPLETKIRGSCDHNGKNYSIIITDNDNLQSLFPRNKNSRNSEEMLIENNRALCNEEISKSVKGSDSGNSTCIIPKISIEHKASRDQIVFHSNLLSDSVDLFSVTCNSPENLTIEAACDGNECVAPNVAANTTYSCIGKVTEPSNNLSIEIALPLIKTDIEFFNQKNFNVTSDSTEIEVTWRASNNESFYLDKFLAVYVEPCGTHRDGKNKRLSYERIDIETDSGPAFSFSKVDINNGTFTVTNLESSTCYDVSLLACSESNILKCIELVMMKTTTLEKKFDIRDYKLHLILLGLLMIFPAILLLKRYRKMQKDKITDVEGEFEEDKSLIVERSQYVVLNAIGKGQFGKVYKGYLKKKTNECVEESVDQPSINREYVAIKTVRLKKPESMSDDEYESQLNRVDENFIKEAKRMSKLKSRHVVQLKGYWISDKPYYVLMEYMEHSDLGTFLRSNKAEPAPHVTSNYSQKANPPEKSMATDPPKIKHKIRPFVHMALEIADGMAYLEKMKYVHRDLAARNCMVAADFTIKIGDFGLSRFIDISNYYIPASQWEKPYRWLAPECFDSEKFSIKSDVFSFGILLWELVTFCDKNPYPNLKNYEEVKRFVTNGELMEKPVNCVEDFYDLMKKCWKLNSRKRISFLRLVKRLLSQLTDVEIDNEFLRGFKIDSFYYNQNSNEVESKTEDREDDEQNNLDHKTDHDQNEERIEICVPHENHCNDAFCDDTNKVNDIEREVHDENGRNHANDIELQEIIRAP